MKTLNLVVIVALCLGTAVRASAEKESYAKWAQYEFVFVGKLERIDGGQIRPARFNFHFTPTKVLRGNLKPGQDVSFFRFYGEFGNPQKSDYPAPGTSCLVAGVTADHGSRVLRELVAATDDNIAAVTAACEVLCGWRMEAGKLISPWANLGDTVWPKAAGTLDAKQVCAKTGRPALICGEGVQLTVAPVPPAKSIKWTNPDGDGEYRLTVLNTTDKLLRVPALLTDGKDILWDNSIVILCQDKAYPLPGCRKNLAKVQSVTLQPGQSVSGVVNPLPLDGPNWPRGGYRISFQFCLGETSVTHAFYYYSSHHDKIRQVLRNQ